VGYWNGLAMLVALALPLLLRHAGAARSRLASGAAVAAIPPIAVDSSLASSRGGAVVGLVAVATFIALCRERLRVASAAVVGVAGGVAAVLVLEAQPVLVDGPFGTHAASVAGREVVWLLLVVVAATGAAWFALEPLVRRIPAPPRRVAIGGLVAAVVALVLLVALSHPIARFHDFSRPPAAPDAPRFVRAHLVSGSGSGRWQFWGAAVDEWRSAPVAGSGAGSFGAWWAEHGSLAMFVRNAHSLYLESLGELGAVGFLLITGVWAGGCAIGVRTCRRADGEPRSALAAATA